MHRFASLLASILLLSGCTYTAFEDVQCERTADCPADAVCRSGFCAYDELPTNNTNNTNNANNLLRVVSVTVAPPTGSLTPEQTLQASAVAANSEGTALDDVTFTWASSNEDVATVDATGLITAVDVGVADITATADGVSGTLVLTVENPVASITITPAMAEVGLNTQVTLTAEAFDARGNTLTRAVNWSSADTTVATVSNAGVVFGAGVGMTTVSASADGVTGVADITVLDYPIVSLEIDPATARVRQGATLSLRGVLKNDQGTEVLGETIGWSYNPAILGGLAVPDVDRPDIVAFTASTTQTGNVTISGTFEGLMATSVVEVYRPAVKTVTVSPAPATAKIGALVSFNATVIDEDDLPLTGRTVEWFVSDSTVATIDPLGVVTTRAPGVVTITATVEGVMGTSELTVAGFELQSVSTGLDHSCGITPAGFGFCWGEGANGRLGIDATTDKTLPTPVATTTTFDTIHAADQHTCALSAGVAYCWGAQASGRLGNNQTSGDQDTPQLVAGDRVFLQLSAMNDHTCAVDENNAILCWGEGDHGRLGSNATTDLALPTVIVAPAADPTATWTQVAAGHEHSCGLTTLGKVFCWGRNQLGQLGDGTTDDSRVAVAVDTSAIGNPTFTQIGAGHSFSCGLTDTGALYCWGSNTAGKLGIGSTDSNRTTPAQVMGMTFTSVDLGSTHACGVSGGLGYCWGSGADGRLGNNDTVDKNVPTLVDNSPMFSSISAGGHTCGVSAGAGLCWGLNEFGELGDGTTTNTSVPTTVYP